MPVLKCKMCGGSLLVEEGSSLCHCDYCGNDQTVPHLDSQKKTNLFARADSLLQECRFEEAACLYELIRSEYPNEAEAHWGLLLSRYGIEYVEDPQTRKRLPTCHRTSYESVLAHEAYRQTLQTADIIARRIYEAEAKRIESVRMGIVDAVANTEPFDVFICYKETDPLGERTEASVLAQEIYQQLTTTGLRVFFSRITLEDKLGSTYEPIIFAALNSAPVMLVIGTEEKHFTEVWVKNEWSRFLDYIRKGKKKVLIPCYLHIDPSGLPSELASLQAQDLSKLGAIQDITRAVVKMARPDAPNSTAVASLPLKSVTALTQRGYLCLEDGEYGRAAAFFERSLDDNPADGYAYLGKFLCKQRVASLDVLKDEIIAFEDDKNFSRALRFANRELEAVLRKVLACNTQNIADKARREKEAEDKRLAWKKAREDHQRECAKIEEAIQSELESQFKTIEDRYAQRLTPIYRQLGIEESTALREKVRLQGELTRVQRERSSLGLFDKARKAELDEVIGRLSEEIQNCPTPTQLREKFQFRLDPIEYEREEEKRRVEEAVRDKYPLPKLVIPLTLDELPNT